jgi:hypothetical protein
VLTSSVASCPGVHTMVSLGQQQTPEAILFNAISTVPTVVTDEELARHRSNGDLWIVVDGNVYNIAKFIESHPGGGAVRLPSVAVYQSNSSTLLIWLIFGVSAARGIELLSYSLSDWRSYAETESQRDCK